MVGERAGILVYIEWYDSYIGIVTLAATQHCYDPTYHSSITYGHICIAIDQYDYGDFFSSIQPSITAIVVQKAWPAVAILQDRLVATFGSPLDCFSVTP